MAIKARFALDAEAPILPYYNDYFGTPYPLPKLDNVAGPGQSQFFGAMENWGAIFTFEYAMLLDPAITSAEPSARTSSAPSPRDGAPVVRRPRHHGVVGRPLAQRRLRQLDGEQAPPTISIPTGAPHRPRRRARSARWASTRFNSTHPVVQQVRTVEQANQAFDAISYSKGESVIAMLEEFAGAESGGGIRGYIARHAYRNSRTDDLWAAMERAGATGLATIAHDFTGQPGIPLIQVGPAQCVNGQTVAMLAQGQYCADQRERAMSRPLSWHVPIRATAGGAAAQVVTSGRTGNITVPGCGPLLINPGQTGYFRTLYTPEEARALRTVFTSLRAVDQYGMLADQLALSGAGYQPAPESASWSASIKY